MGGEEGLGFEWAECLLVDQVNCCVWTAVELLGEGGFGACWADLSCGRRDGWLLWGGLPA
jgi:hypothetical protein